MINPEIKQIKDSTGTMHDFVISTMPAIDGRYVLSQYPLSNMPKTGDYNVSKDAMLVMMRHVGKVMPSGETLKLTTEALINNHVPDAEALIRIEIEMLKKNTSFFQVGGASTFLDYLKEKMADSLPSIIKTLTDSLQSSYPQDSQVTPNSKAQSVSKKR